MKFKDMDLEAAEAEALRAQEFIESAVWSAKDQWIKEHGSIINDRHPLDEYNANFGGNSDKGGGDE